MEEATVSPNPEFIGNGYLEHAGGSRGNFRLRYNIYPILEEGQLTDDIAFANATASV